MDKQITLVLPLSAVIELTATLSIALDLREKSNDFLREVEASIKEQAYAQATVEEFRESAHCISVQSMMGRTP